MSHTAAKLAVATLVLAALPVAYLRQEHTRLLRENTASPAPAITLPETTPGTAPAAGRVADGAVLAAWEELRTAQTGRVQAEEKRAALQREVERVETEVVVSYGPIEDLGRKFARQLAQLQKFEAVGNEPDLAKRAQLAQEFAKIIQDLGGLLVTAREAQKLESDPEKAARFYSALLGESVGLDAAAREPVARVVRERFQEMTRTGVIASQRPRTDDVAWKQARRAAFSELEAAMLAVLPAERRAESKKLTGMIAHLADGPFEQHDAKGDAK